MRKIWESLNQPMALYITIKCSGKSSFRVWAEDLGKVNSKYADRTIEVQGERTIFFSFPITPQRLAITCIDLNNPSNTGFSFDVVQQPLKTYNVWLDDETRSFLQLAIHFSQVCGFENTSPKGRVFQTDSGEFTIKFYDVIRDQMSGKALSTPARIGHRSGIIDTSKAKFDTYTFAMRMIILLHEFSHKYKNPKINLEIDNEIGADINALYIYLGLGFSKVDAIYVFANVFLSAQSSSNLDRMRKIMDYIQKFENQEFAQLN